MSRKKYLFRFAFLFALVSLAFVLGGQPAPATTEVQTSAPTSPYDRAEQNLLLAQKEQALRPAALAAEEASQRIVNQMVASVSATVHDEMTLKTLRDTLARIASANYEGDTLDSAASATRRILSSHHLPGNSEMSIGQREALQTILHGSAQLDSARYAIRRHDSVLAQIRAQQRLARYRD